MLKGILERLLKGKKAESVRYGEEFFAEGWFRNWEVMKPVLLELIRTGPGWKRVLDFGCGPGVMIDYMNGLGYDYTGCDPSDDARRLYLERFGKYPGKYVKGVEDVGGRYDLFLSFDVFEHMADSDILSVLEKATAPFYLVNISRAKHIPGHINIKKDKGWLRLFRRAGLEYEEGLTEAVRKRYLELRPGGEDLWHKNLFVLRRRG